MKKTFGTIKTITVGGVEFVLKASTNLLFLYKTLWGSDLMSDLANMFGTTNQAELKKVIDGGAALSADMTVMPKVILAMQLNAMPEEERPEITEETIDSIPMELLTDTDAMAEIVDLLTGYVGNAKNVLTP